MSEPTPEIKEAEELEFRVIMCSLAVQTYGFMIVAAANSPTPDSKFINVLKHQMDIAQQLAVKFNTRYADLMTKMQMRKQMN